jgi:hypothetical protein
MAPSAKWRVSAMADRQDPVGNGAQVEKVDEPLFASSPIFVFEMEAYPEAKALLGTDLRRLHRVFGSWYRVAELVGSSEAFVRQNSGDS